MIKPRLKLLDTEALAAWLHVAPGTIRRWASEDRWHPYGTRRYRLWSLRDAEASYNQRHADQKKAG